MLSHRRYYEAMLGLLWCSLMGGCTATAIRPSPPHVTAPTHSPTVTIVTPTPVPLDLSPYKQAMLPQFAADVEAVVADGVSRYKIELTIDEISDSQGVKLSGRVQLHYTNNETVTLDTLYFHLYPNLPGYGGKMEVQQVIMAKQPVTPTLEAKNSALRVPLAHPLQPHESLDLTLNYTAQVPVEPTEGYNIFSYSEGTLALAGFYPALAVYDEQGWNIPIPPPYGDATYLDVSLYQTTVTVPTDMRVVATGSLLNQNTPLTSTKTLTFASGPMRDFYLVMRPDFQVVSDTIDGIVVNSYYPPDLAEGGQRVLKYTTDALHFYNTHFGLYPYAEFDVVATPTNAGGVEYPGVVVAAEQFYDQTGGYLQHVVGHEVAHQWWYGVVGNNQVTTPWLDEALTNYSTLLYWREVEGDEVAQQITQDFFRRPYEQAQKEGHDRPVAGAVSDFAPEDYGPIVYGKGPLFFLALQEQVGDDVFYKITQTYYTQYRYKIARPEDFIAVSERVYGKSITPLYQHWIIGQ